MTEEQKIRMVVDLFLDGKTTVGQEEWLFEQFSRPDLPPSLAPMREMMAWYAAGLRSESAKSDVAETHEGITASKSFKSGKFTKFYRVAAAVAVAVISVSMLLYFGVGSTAGEGDEEVTVCYMIRDGVRYTDPAIVLPEMARLDAATRRRFAAAVPPEPKSPEAMFREHLQQKYSTSSVEYKTMISTNVNE